MFVFHSCIYYSTDLIVIIVSRSSHVIARRALSFRVFYRRQKSKMKRIRSNEYMMQNITKQCLCDMYKPPFFGSIRMKALTLSTEGKVVLLMWRPCGFRSISALVPHLFPLAEFFFSRPSMNSCACEASNVASKASTFVWNVHLAGVWEREGNGQLSGEQLSSN